MFTKESFLYICSQNKLTGTGVRKVCYLSTSQDFHACPSDIT